MNALSGPASDCERLVDGFLGQPVNSISALALVAAGILLLSARRPLVKGPIGLLAGMLILTGLGSALFHGSDGRIAAWMHDASLAGLLLLIAGFEISRRIGRRWSTPLWLTAFALVALLVGLHPNTGPLIQATAAAGVVALVVGSGPDRRRRLLLPLVLLAFGFAVYLLSRTDGPLCDPDSLLQGHAVWHVLTAVALLLYGLRLPWVTPELRRQR